MIREATKSGFETRPYFATFAFFAVSLLFAPQITPETLGSWLIARLDRTAS